MYDEILDSTENKKISSKLLPKITLCFLWFFLSYWLFTSGKEILFMYINNSWGLLPTLKVPIEKAYEILIHGFFSCFIAILIFAKPKLCIQILNIFLGVIALNCIEQIFYFHGLGIIFIPFLLIFISKLNSTYLFLGTIMFFEIS